MTNEWQEVGSMTDSQWDRVKPIEGILMEKKEGVGPNLSKLYVLKVKDETVGVWGGTVLDTKFAMIPAGWEVRIEPLGKATSKSGKEYSDYKVSKRPTPFSEVVEGAVTANDNGPEPEYTG